MEEKVKVTVEFAGQYYNYDDTAVVVITPNQKLITLNCDGIDLHKLAVLLDMALEDILNTLNKNYGLNYVEIFNRMAEMKKVMKVQEEC